MGSPTADAPPSGGFWQGYKAVSTRVTNILGFVAGTAVVFMMVVTCVDIVLRWFRVTLPGAYDMVQIAGTIAIACALPYTTAVKGHVAIEYFFHKLGRRGRLVVDAVTRVVVIILFSCIAWYMVRYGFDLKKNGQVSLTLELPIFWTPWVIAASCVAVVVVKIFHLFHPGREMIKP
jgi:TRAP-type C4-dicarboxylate transport system permease small subunit